MDDGISIADEGGTGPLRLWGHNLSKHPKTIGSKNSNGGCWQRTNYGRMHTQNSLVYGVVAEGFVGAFGSAICGRIPHRNVYKHDVGWQSLTLSSSSPSV